MSQTPNQRLEAYLGQLSPQSLALLIREFERAVERGDDAAFAGRVLEQLRKVVRGADQPTTARAHDPARVLFRPLEPFLIEGKFPARPGQVNRASLLPVWQWLSREGASEKAREFAEAVSQDAADEATVHKFQLAAGEAILGALHSASGSDRQRVLARVGPPEVVEDLPSIGSVLQSHEALDVLDNRLPSYLRAFADPQIQAVRVSLNVPSLQSPFLLPFALSLIMQRLQSPWQIIRLAVKMAGSDDEIRVAGTPYGIAVSLALHDLCVLAAGLHSDIRRGHFDDIAEHLKILHDGVRGLRTELDLRSDSPWGRQLTSLRADISNALQAEIDSVPGRVRRLLRQRGDKDVVTASIDPGEVEEVAALIDFVAVCRTYASELAINEVTLRTYSDLQNYVEHSTQALIQALRGGDAKIRSYRQKQVQAAIRFCDILFGKDYASLMARAAENAAPDEGKALRSG